MGTERLNEIESDIKATADDIASDAKVMGRIEAEKATLDPADPRIVELANASEAIAAKMAVKTKVETALVTEAHEDTIPS